MLNEKGKIINWFEARIRKIRFQSIFSAEEFVDCEENEPIGDHLSYEDIFNLVNSNNNEVMDEVKEPEKK